MKKEKLNQKFKKYPIILGITILLTLIILPSSFAGQQPIRSIEVFSEKLNYQKKEPGAWKVTESAKWIIRKEAEVTLNVESILKNNENNNLDVLYILDTSESMRGDKIQEISNSLSKLSKTLLDNKENRVGIITFNESAKIILNFSNDLNNFTNGIDSISAQGLRSFYKALISIDGILKDYKPIDNKKCIVLLFTDGNPNLDTPNEIGIYNYIKDKYPYLSINAIQYGSTTKQLQSLKNISDKQYTVNKDNIDNVLSNILNTSKIYDNFLLTNYINTDQFYIENESDIKTDNGNFIFDKAEQKIIWNISNYRTNQNTELKIKLKLKKEYSNEESLYLINNLLKVTSNIDEIEEDVISNNTPILSNKYQVFYDDNAPSTCKITGMPDDETHFVFETVNMTEITPKCEGYQFKGWQMTTRELSNINDDYFTMPESDVHFKALWSKIQLKKSMKGEVGEFFTLYDQVEQDVAINSKYAKKYTGDTSTFNGNKNIYYYYGEANNNNVIFASYCWKIVRTTDTGGVKLLYNGIPRSNGSCGNTGDDSQLTATQMNLSSNVVNFNEKNSSLADVGYMYNTRYDYQIKNNSTLGTLLFGNYFTYNNGLYTLTATKTAQLSSQSSSLDYQHYTCFSNLDKCETASYVYYSFNNSYYINLTGGKSIDNALNEMLYDNNINKNNSKIKTVIDYWFENNMTKYTNYLEDEIWCNNRSMNNKNENGWNSNGGKLSVDLSFNSSADSSNLTCPNRVDRFTVNSTNGNGNLTYPVGLITKQEQTLSYVSGKSPLATGNYYWTLSPAGFYNSSYIAYGYSVSGSGVDSLSIINGNSGVRPAISLRSGIGYSRGDGSINSPYFISTN